MAEKKRVKERECEGHPVWKRPPTADHQLGNGAHCRGDGCWDIAGEHALAGVGYKPHVVRVLALETSAMISICRAPQHHTHFSQA
jgi:hypothetical protein